MPLSFGVFCHSVTGMAPKMFSQEIAIKMQMEYLEGYALSDEHTHNQCIKHRAKQGK